MVDRAPTKPNRYAVYDENHNFIRYEYHERADEPTQVGDALNKANLLPDAVATALGLTGNPQVKDALAKIKTLLDGKCKVETGSYIGTGTYGPANEKSLTFNGTPYLFVVSRFEIYSGEERQKSNIMFMPVFSLTSSYQIYQNTSFNGSGYSVISGSFGGSVYSKVVGKTISWYAAASSADQYNDANYKYKYMALTI